MRCSLPSLLLLLPALAVAQPLKVAVLEVHNPAGLSEQEAAYLTDVVRAEALELPRDRYFVMTRENLLAQLPPGTDLAACVGRCEVETGRNVGADFVVSGEVVRFGESLKVSLKLHDTHAGQLLGAETGTAQQVEALEAAVRGAAGRLFAARAAEPAPLGTAPLGPAPLGTPPGPAPIDRPGPPTVIAGRTEPGFEEHLARGQDRLDRLWPADAAVSFKRALAERPDHHEARAGLVQAHALTCLLELRQRRGRPDEAALQQCTDAIEDARRYVRERPHARVYLRLAQIHEQLGERGAAASAYRRYAELTPGVHTAPSADGATLQHRRPGCAAAPGTPGPWPLLALLLGLFPLRRGRIS